MCVFCVHCGARGPFSSAMLSWWWQGFGKELFTDAGKYVIHFGTEATAATAEEQRRQLEQGQGGSASASASPAAGPPPSTSDQAPGTASTTPAVIPTFTGNQLVRCAVHERLEGTLHLACAPRAPPHHRHAAVVAHALRLTAGGAPAAGAGRAHGERCTAMLCCAERGEGRGASHVHRLVLPPLCADHPRRRHHH